MKKIVNYCFMVVALLLLTHCGGSGGGSNDNNSNQVVVNLDDSQGNVAHGANNVSLIPIIALKFSAAIDPSSLRPDHFILSSNSQATNADLALSHPTLNADNTIVTFYPIDPLQLNTTYYLNLTKGIRTVNGQTIPDHQFSFTTTNDNSPSVSLLNILEGATNVTSNNTEIQIKFSKSVSNVNASSISLHEEAVDGPKVAIQITNLGNNLYKISPTSGYLKRETNYHLVLSAAIHDLLYVPLATTNFQFSTRPGYAYIVNRGPNPTTALINKCHINKEDNFLGECSATGNGFNAPRRIVFSPKGNWAYVSNRTGDYISACAVTESDGSLNCSKFTLNVPVDGPAGLAISKSGSHLFIVNTDASAENSLTTCSLTSAGVLLPNSCVNSSLPAITNKLFSISLDNSGKRVYFAEDSTSAKFITCNFDGENLSSIQNCKVAYAELHSYPAEIIFNRQGTFAYQATTGTNRVLGCAVNADGSLNCNNSFTDFDEPFALALSSDGLNFYATNGDSLRICSINPTTQLLYNCNLTAGMDRAAGIYLRY